MRRGLYRLNSTVMSCRLNALTCISSRRSAGKLFHTRGPATGKLLSPKVLWVRGGKHVLYAFQLCYNTISWNHDHCLFLRFSQINSCLFSDLDMQSSKHNNSVFVPMLSWHPTQVAIWVFRPAVWMWNLEFHFSSLRIWRFPAQKY